MEAVERSTLRLPLVRSVRLDPAGFAAWLMPVLLIVYLALSNGGYDVIERSDMGIAVWWMVLVGTLVGALPAAGGTRQGRGMLGLLAAFAGWTALSMTWTASSEQTASELGRTATYLGVFALALAVQGNGRWRHVLSGTTTGLAIVCGLAVMSRLEPTWFPRNRSGQFLPGIEIARRLSYPLNYSSGLGALAAIALPLLLAATASARTLVVQALAAAALPVAALTLWLTSSSLSLPAATIALGVFLVLSPNRPSKLATLAIAGAGSAILLAAIEQRDALSRGLPTPAALREGSEIEVFLIVVCVGVALAQVGLSLAVRYGERPASLRTWVYRARRMTVLGAAALIVAGLIAIASGWVGDRWHSFTTFGDASSDRSSTSQILDFNSSGRYQFWQSAVDASKTDPLVGIGPGTFQFWWAEHGSYAGYTRDAHSLYVETLAELGIVGLLMIGGFSLALLWMGAARAMRAPPELRLGIAAATAGCAAFMATATVDWVWELGVLACVFMVLAAVVVAGGLEPDEPGARHRSAWRAHRGQVALAVLACGALFAIAVPLGATSEVGDSQSAAAGNSLDQAMADARDAAAVQPYAATPYIQEALVLEQQGQYAAAASAARTATEKETANWRNWVILSRLEAEAGDAQASVDAYRKARSLNPRSGLFAP